MKLLGTPKDNVFEKNPGLDLIDYCADMIKEYKGEMKASKVFWALYLIYHPESTIFDMNIENKKVSVMRDHMKSKKNFDDLYSHLIPGFIEHIVYDPIAKLLVLVKRQIDKYFNKIAYLEFDVRINEDKDLLIQANNLSDLSGYEKKLEEWKRVWKKYQDASAAGKLQEGVKEGMRERSLRLRKQKSTA